LARVTVLAFTGVAERIEIENPKSEFSATSATSVVRNLRCLDSLRYL